MVEITTANFEEKVLKSEKPVFLDFWATWCGFCIQLTPTIEELEKEHPEVVFGKVNVDEEPQLAAQFGIMSIPVTMVFRNGQLSSKVMGALPKEELVRQHNL
ncbi:MAG: thioredoxin [Eubacterium sp.]|nr:thioredoxin [Eubacterium sp.]